MRVFAKTDLGKVRELNEDCYASTILPDGAALAIVCDGMGGANAGDVASRLAVEVILRYVLNAYNPSMTSQEITDLLVNAISSANITIFDESKKNEQYFGMGTTVVATIARDDFAIVCNAGDSRAYIIDDNITQITRDHSIVQSLIESGRITPEEARVHPEKNVITRALGVDEYIMTDSYCVDLTKDDKLLLCTDGFSNYVSNDCILNIIKANALDDVTNLLVQQANDGGGRDNITVAVIAH